MSYEQTLWKELKDVVNPKIFKKQNRLDTFVSSLTGFLKINGIEWEPTKNNVLEVGLDQNFKVFYITYSYEGVISKYFSLFIACVWFLGNRSSFSGIEQN